MSEHTQPASGGHGGLYFIVGILVVLVAIIAYVMLGGDMPWNSGANLDVDVNLPTPSAGGEGGGQ